MKKTLVVFMLLIASISVLAHTLQSQDGINVSHDHYSTCEFGCPDTVGFENFYSFDSIYRINSGTWKYNCHGRTFDNSYSWVDYSDAWIFGYGNQSVYPPAPGDVVVWYTGSGTPYTTITGHTATIVGTWNGNNTIVSSKYGRYGEYKHELFNTINVYGNNYTFVRLNTATVYSIGEDYTNKPLHSLSLIDKNKSDKWKAKDKFTKLQSKDSISKLPLKKQIDFLIFDLVKTERDFYLGAYSLPNMTEDEVAEIDSGNMLLDIAIENSEMVLEIGNRLKEIITSSSIDSVRGIAMYFLSSLEKETGTYWDIYKLYPEQLENPNKFSYFDYYLIKSMN